jgi:transcriptional regulator with XRE-family HTH domain
VIAKEDLKTWRKLLGAILRRCRVSRNLTVSAAARAARLSRTTLVAIEGGRQGTSCDQLIVLAAVYRCRPGWLFPPAASLSFSKRSPPTSGK